MRFEIILAPEALTDLDTLRAAERSAVRDAIETHLRHQPTQVSKSRIKRLEGLASPQYRLRIEDIRVFYDVTEADVEVLAILDKTAADRWLREVAEQRDEEERKRHEEGGTLRS